MQPKQVIGEEDAEKQPELIQDTKENGNDDEEQPSEMETGEIEYTREIADFDEELF